MRLILAAFTLASLAGLAATDKVALPPSIAEVDGFSFLGVEAKTEVDSEAQHEVGERQRRGERARALLGLLPFAGSGAIVLFILLASGSCHLDYCARCCGEGLTCPLFGVACMVRSLATFLLPQAAMAVAAKAGDGAAVGAMNNCQNCVYVSGRRSVERSDAMLAFLETFGLHAY